MGGGLHQEEILNRFGVGACVNYRSDIWFKFKLAEGVLQLLSFPVYRIQQRDVRYTTTNTLKTLPFRARGVRSGV